MKLIHVVESKDDQIVDIKTFLSKQNDERIKELADEYFLNLIQEYTLPAILDDESKEHWIKKRIYKFHNVKIEIVYVSSYYELN